MSKKEIVYYDEFSGDNTYYICGSSRICKNNTCYHRTNHIPFKRCVHTYCNYIGHFKECKRKY